MASDDSTPRLLLSDLFTVLHTSLAKHTRNCLCALENGALEICFLVILSMDGNAQARVNAARVLRNAFAGEFVPSQLIFQVSWCQCFWFVDASLCSVLPYLPDILRSLLECFTRANLKYIGNEGEDTANGVVLRELLLATYNLVAQGSLSLCFSTSSSFVLL